MALIDDIQVQICVLCTVYISITQIIIKYWRNKLQFKAYQDIAKFMSRSFNLKKESLALER